MDSANIYLLSVYLKKWSYNDNRFTINYSFCVENYEYHRKYIDLRAGRNHNLVDDLINQVIRDAKSFSESSNLNIVNGNEIRKKLNQFIGKITKEFRSNKKNRGKSRMISNRSLDFYYNDHEYEQLTPDVKYYVHLNRGLNKVNGDLWSNAVVDFKLALEHKPGDPTANKYLAMAYNKLGQFSEAVEPLKICADAENSSETLNALAMAYINLEEYEKADDLYCQISENFGDEHLALYGQAQIAYKSGKDYLSYLDKLYEIDSEWLVEKLKKDWEYRLAMEIDEQNMWNAATAARYLGFKRPYDLTRKAFNSEIPCYFDAEKGTIRFVKEELDCWINLHNHFNLDGQNYQTFEDKLLPEEKKLSKRKINLLVLLFPFNANQPLPCKKRENLSFKN